MVLRTEPRAPPVLGNCSTTELQPQHCKRVLKESKTYVIELIKIWIFVESKYIPKIL